MNKFAVVSALVLGAFGTSAVMAQAASAPTRGEVKSEVPKDRTHDQNITGERMPTADQLPPKPKKQKKAKSGMAASQPAK